MRDKILQTALEQFFEHGIRDISIQKLISPLGISTKTVYKYFKNKEDILEFVLERMYKQRYDLLEEIKYDQPAVIFLFNIWYIAIEREFNVNNKFYYDLKHYYPELNHKSQIKFGSLLWKQFLQIFLKGIKEGLFHEHVYPEVAMEGLATLFHAITREKRFTKFNMNSFDIYYNTIYPYIRGFCTGKGISLLDEYVKTLDPTTHQENLFPGMYL